MTLQQYLENFSRLYKIEYVCRHSYKRGQHVQKDIELFYEDIFHYNKIIVVLIETDRLIKEIDNVLEF